MRKSKQCGQKKREEHERAGMGISYIKMRSTVLSVEENKTRASAAATAPHRRQQESYKADKAAPSLQSANHYSVGIGISVEIGRAHV